MKGEIMKQATGIILIIILFFSLQLTASAAEPLKVGIIDFQRCVQESNEGKRIADSLKNKQIEMQKDLDKKQQELLDMQKDMEKQSLMLSMDAKEDKQKEFNKKRQDLNYFVQDSDEEFKKIRQDALIGIQNIIINKVNTIAQEKKFDLILARSEGGVLFFSKALDITDEVIAGINKDKP